MKFVARNVNVMTLVEGVCVMTFDCSPIISANLRDLKKEEEYTFEIEKARQKRSKSQNSLLWELIGQICEAENGNKKETEDIYLQLLEEASSSVQFLMTIPEAEDDLKKVFRIVKAVDEREYNGRMMTIFKCFIGSSQMDTKQMSILIDKAIIRAETDGLQVEYYKEEFEKYDL